MEHYHPTDPCYKSFVLAAFFEYQTVGLDFNWSPETIQNSFRNVCRGFNTKYRFDQEDLKFILSFVDEDGFNYYKNRYQNLAVNSSEAFELLFSTWQSAKVLSTNDPNFFVRMIIGLTTSDDDNHHSYWMYHEFNTLVYVRFFERFVEQFDLDLIYTDLDPFLKQRSKDQIKERRENKYLKLKKSLKKSNKNVKHLLKNN